MVRELVQFVRDNIDEKLEEEFDKIFDEENYNSLDEVTVESLEPFLIAEPLGDQVFSERNDIVEYFEERYPETFEEKVDHIIIRVVNHYLENYEQHIEDTILVDMRYNKFDREQEKRDPHGYRGVSKSDF